MLSALYLYCYPVDKDAAAANKIRAKLEELEGYDMQAGVSHAAKRQKKAAILAGEKKRRDKEARKGWFKNPMGKGEKRGGSSSSAKLEKAKKDALKRGKAARKKTKKEAAKFALAMR